MAGLMVGRIRYWFVLSMIFLGILFFSLVARHSVTLFRSNVDMCRNVKNVLHSFTTTEKPLIQGSSEMRGWCVFILEVGSVSAQSGVSLTVYIAF